MWLKSIAIRVTPWLVSGNASHHETHFSFGPHAEMRLTMRFILPSTRPAAKVGLLLYTNPTRREVIDLFFPLSRRTNLIYKEDNI